MEYNYYILSLCSLPFLSVNPIVMIRVSTKSLITSPTATEIETKFKPSRIFYCLFNQHSIFMMIKLEQEPLGKEPLFP